MSRQRPTDRERALLPSEVFHIQLRPTTYLQSLTHIYSHHEQKFRVSVGCIRLHTSFSVMVVYSQTVFTNIFHCHVMIAYLPL